MRQPTSPPGALTRSAAGDSNNLMRFRKVLRSASARLSPLSHRRSWRARRALAPPRRPSRATGRSQKRGRRLYNVSLNPAQGAEMSFPALPRLAVSWRIASGVLVLILGFAIYQLWTSPGYRVDAAQVSGLQRVTSNDVNTALGVTGKPVFTLDAGKIETDLLAAFPEFKTAEVKVVLPNTVMITVTERLPMMIWLQEGRSYLVDKDGLTFPIRHEVASGAFPVVEAAGAPPGVVLPDKPGPSLQEVTISKITGVPSAGCANPNPGASAAYDPDGPIDLVGLAAGSRGCTSWSITRSTGWVGKTADGWDVFLGDEQDIAVKLSVYRSILDHLKGTENRPVMISVEYVHAPYYRLEE